MPPLSFNGDSGLVLTVVGCGTMGIAILSGVFAALSDSKPSNGITSIPLSQSGTSTPAEELPPLLPSRFIACVRRPESAKRIKAALSEYPTRIEILLNDNLHGVEAADVVLLCCKPQMFRDILGAEGIRDALKGKLLISILAGVSANQIEETLYGSISDNDPDNEGRCRIVRAMPNTAAAVRESMTVIANPTIPMPAQQAALVHWIFNRIGRVVKLPPTALDASTALCGSGPAFMALVLEALADGAVAMGLPRAEAQMMAAQTMRGTTGIVLNGEHPAILRDKVSTPGGCTISGLMCCERYRVRSALATSIQEATEKAASLDDFEAYIKSASCGSVSQP